MTTLQRFRFYAMDPALIPSTVKETVPRFDLEAWTKRGQAVYWKGSAAHTAAPGEGIALGDGGTLSSDTFYNAFFLGYWLRLTRLDRLSLQLRTRGKVRLEIVQHTLRGETILVSRHDLTNDGTTELAIVLAQLPAAIRLSFTLTGLDARAQLMEGGWRTPDVPNPVRLGIVIATFGRNAFAERVIRRVLDDPGLRQEDIRLVVTDQNPVSELGHLNGDRCRIVTQNNLGYTGGLTRSLYEMIFGEQRFAPTHILLLDDDVDLETDAILRSVRFAQFARKPFLIGGIMLDQFRPSFALCHGENLTPNDDGVRLLRRNLPDTDVADWQGLNAFSIPCDYEYTAGWYCFYPAEINLRLGFQLPFFIQGYEDAEFGLRSRRNGYPTFTIPGIGVWHVPFYSKRDAGWKLALSSYHQMVHHSLYGYEDCSGFFLEAGASVLRELKDGKYWHAAARLRAMEDFLQGWDYFVERTYPGYLKELGQYLANYDAEKQASGVIKKPQVADLKRRLESASRRFTAEGREIQGVFAARLPETYPIDSWKFFFANGNLANLSSRANRK